MFCVTNCSDQTVIRYLAENLRVAAAPQKTAQALTTHFSLIFGSSAFLQ